MLVELEHGWAPAGWQGLVAAVVAASLLVAGLLFATLVLLCVPWGLFPSKP